MTRWCSVRPSRKGSHIRPPAPCRNTTGSPCPADKTLVFHFPPCSSMICSDGVVIPPSPRHWRRRGRGHVLASALRPPTMLPAFVGPEALDLWEDAFGEEG